MYEEEVLSDTRALWFSPDGDRLAWVQFNDSDVDVMPLQIYGQPGRLEFQYPIPTPLRCVRINEKSEKLFMCNAVS